jgi:hypothetical protein
MIRNSDTTGPQSRLDLTNVRAGFVNAVADTKRCGRFAAVLRCLRQQVSEIAAVSIQ